jgi:MFS family permease
LVAALTVCNIVAQVDRFAMTLLIPPMQKDLGLSDTQMGLIGGLVTGLFYALAGLPLARVADQFSRKWLIIVSLIVWSLMTAGMGLAVGFWTLCIARLFLTMGEASLGPAANSMIGNVFAKDQLSRPMSVFASAGSLGNAAASGLVALFLLLAPFVAPPLTFGGEPMAPWRVVMIGLALVGLVPMVMLMMVREPRRPVLVGERPDFRLFVRFLKPRLKAYLPCYLGYAFFVLPFIALNFWLPTALQRVHGMPTTVSGFWLGLGYLLAGAPGTLLGGWLADRWQRQGVVDARLRVLLLSTVLGLPAGAVSQLVSDPWLAIALVWIAMGCAAMALGPVTAAIQALTPDRFRAQAAALLYLLIYIVAFMGIPLTGTLTDGLFGDRQRIGHALAVLSVVFGLLAVAVVARWRLAHVQGLEAAAREGV